MVFAHKRSRCTPVCLFVYVCAATLAQGISPYAPQTVGTHTDSSAVGAYTYDTAGNRLHKQASAAQIPSQTIKMGLEGKITSIQSNNRLHQIHHGLGGRRYLRMYGDRRKTFYLRDMEYRVDTLGVGSSIVRIRAKGYSPVAQVDVTDRLHPAYTHFIQDPLGSPMVAVDRFAGVEKRSRYDPWGQLSEPSGIAQALTAADERTRGYTGHELLAETNMGDWNGRVFDYEIGMFTGPDKFIHSRSIASLNRFALGEHNNPNVTDPTGWAPELMNVFARRRQAAQARRTARLAGRAAALEARERAHARVYSLRGQLRAAHNEMRDLNRQRTHLMAELNIRHRLSEVDFTRNERTLLTHPYIRDASRDEIASVDPRIRQEVDPDVIHTLLEHIHHTDSTIAGSASAVVEGIMEHQANVESTAQSIRSLQQQLDVAAENLTTLGNAPIADLPPAQHP